ncbi:hypothetical protein NL676_037498 [Syzygium grande]|nr:hypothetical protein NL676_037498 [Syzygium grande]
MTGPKRIGPFEKKLKRAPVTGDAFSAGVELEAQILWRSWRTSISQGTTIGGFFDCGSTSR